MNNRFAALSLYGDTYAIPARVEHAIEITDAAKVVVGFTPIRRGYLCQNNK